MNPPLQPIESVVPLERVAKFVRQLTHDVRNGLSAIDLETAFIAEIAEDEEVLVETRKLREMIAETAKMLRAVSQHFQSVSIHAIPWAAATVMEELRKRLQTEFPEDAGRIAVEHYFAAETLRIDLLQTLGAVVAIVRNALEFGDGTAPLRLTGEMRDGVAVLELSEPKTAFEPDLPPEQWGTLPLYSTRPGGYGLGLYQARQITQAQGGGMEIQWTGQALVTRMTLPLEE
ncbi:MAG: hypothetical protein PHQ12_01030 [Chthoniobacteraceae bacterium]|nr:hypothetical protein [Chthoniobacteraceae bacterium]